MIVDKILQPSTLLSPSVLTTDEPLVVQDEDVSVGDYGDGDQSVDRAGEVGQHLVEEANLSKKKRSLTTF